MTKGKDIKELVRRLVEGDEHAFTVIFLDYSNRIYCYALRLTRSESMAEEIVQEVFMKLWLNRQLLMTVAQFEPYLYRIARNHTYNMLRQIAFERTAKEDMEKELAGTGSEMQETFLLSGDHQQILNRALDRLPPQQRLVYNLCHQQGLKYEEVAGQLNISRLTVKTHMQHALRAIRTFIKSDKTITLLFLWYIAGEMLIVF
jgi:RNA polymerase sigma-70 factor (family 1)